MHGIGVQYFYGSTYANIYNNWVEKTKGPGFKIGTGGHQIYNNTIVGCGTENETTWGHGIVTQSSISGGHIYHNIIIQSKRYGIYARGATVSVTLFRNLIAEGLGEWYEMISGDVTESSGNDSNRYESDVAAFNFKAWSDDDNYSNDNFSMSTVKPPQKLSISQ